ncbi:MAG: DUF4097 family beta strand repeat protein, partial [Actinobacteria bacterium]|nr:DUF4097 family beta strand repeat protein [Actinomycetota bacterium]
MKTNVKKLVIWLVIIMAVSFGIAAIVLVMTGNFSVASEKIDDSKQFDPEGITEIVVDIVSPELNIIPSDRKDIVVHFHGETSTNIRRNIPELVAYKTGSKLNIEIHQPGGFFIGINFQRTTMDVYVPQVQLERMELKTVSGNVTMED